MKQRCFNEKSSSYKYYGGRGVTVCAEWRDDFDAFYEHMGPRPSPKHTIDRIDNNGNYEPGNCRWATYEVQANNRSNNRHIEYDGRLQTASQWEQELGMHKGVAVARMRRGQSALFALSTPSIPIKKWTQKNNPKKKKRRSVWLCGI